MNIEPLAVLVPVRSHENKSESFQTKTGIELGWKLVGVLASLMAGS